jgi:hypothetical protein
MPLRSASGIPSRQRLHEQLLVIHPRPRFTRPASCPLQRADRTSAHLGRHVMDESTSGKRGCRIFPGPDPAGSWCGRPCVLIKVFDSQLGLDD